MSDSSKKLQTDSAILLVFHLSAEHGLTFASIGSHVWTNFRRAEYERDKRNSELKINWKLMRSREPQHDYVIYSLRTERKNMTKVPGKSQWTLKRGAYVRLVDGDDLLMFRMEAALERS